MFDVLMYLFKSYLHIDREAHIDQRVLFADLMRDGFHRDDIYRALNWLEKLAYLHNHKEEAYLKGATPGALRIYTEQEMHRLDVSCRGLLLYLEQNNVLNSEKREMVIDRCMELDIREFDLADLKWVIQMVLCNVEGHEYAYQRMEALLQDADPKTEQCRNN